MSKPVLVGVHAYGPPYPHATGYEVRVQIGARPHAKKDRAYFPAGTHWVDMQAWRTSAATRLRKQSANPHTLAADVERYLTSEGTLGATLATRRRQQLAWWCAQPAALDAPVLSVEQVRADAALVDAGGQPVDRGTTLGETRRRDLSSKRLRQILWENFKPTSDDPTAYASTSNAYRTALYHLHTMLDMDDEDARNPLDKVDVRAHRGPQPHGQDMRIVQLVLDHLVASKTEGRGVVSLRRAEVLAYCPMTPVHLERFNPEKDFLDVPHATRAELAEGVVVVRLQPRRKGRRKVLPPPSFVPLTPRGVDAMRRYVATPEAWHNETGAVDGNFDRVDLNRMIKRACRRVETVIREHGIDARLRAQGVHVDLSDFTLYHLKHSLTACMELAAPGLIDQWGDIQTDKAVSEMLGHTTTRTTKFYNRRIVAPRWIEVTKRTARLLDELFADPLIPTTQHATPKLRRIK